MNPQFLSEKFAAALPYPDYVKAGTEEQNRRWHQAFDASHLTAPQTQLIATFTRQMHILIISGIWCGDCAQQCPLMQRIAEANPSKIHLRLIDRDLHKDLSDPLKINGAVRVPQVLFLAEDFELCSSYGERTLNRYRTLARRQLGDSCEIAIAPPDPNEHAINLQDWQNEFERIQLMLRISPRLRQLHGD